MSASTRTTYTSPAGTVAVDSLTKQILVTQNRLVRLPKFGGEEENITCTQGCFRPRTSYSGTTHTGCAVCDLTAYNWKNRLIVADLLGADYMHRLSSEGNWPEHGHQMTRGMGCAADSLKWQLAEVRAGRNGLANRGPDRDAHLRSGLWTLAIYQGRTGIIEASQATRVYDGPASSRTVVAEVVKGYRTNAIMEVRNRFGNVWFVTDRGNWGVSSKWVKV